MTYADAPYSESLWRRDARRPAFVADPLEGEATADVAIVGAGFCGLSAALHLAEAGRSVVALEAQDVGFGASGRNGGQVNPGMKLGLGALQSRFGAEAGARFHALGAEAADFLVDLIDRLGLDCDLERRGVVRLAHNPPAADAMNAAADALEADGVELARLPDVDAVEARTGTRRYVAGYVDPRGAAVRPQDLAAELARAAQAAGVRIHTGSRAHSLVQDGGGWRVKTARGEVRAAQVVVATNGYADGLVPGLAESLLPVNSFQIATEPLPEALRERILPGRETVYDSRRLVLYFRRTSDHRVALGGRASFSSDRAAGTTSPDYRQLTRVLAGIFPELVELPIAERWTGLVCITRDFLPHYHRPAEGLHVIAGFNGRGVAMSHRAGAWIARSLAGLPDSVAIPPTPIRPFPLHRFRAPILNLAMKAQHALDLIGR